MPRAVSSVTLTKPSYVSGPSSPLTAVDYCFLISSAVSKTQIIQQVLPFFQLIYLKTCVPTPGVVVYVKISFSSLKKNIAFFTRLRPVVVISLQSKSLKVTRKGVQDY